LMAQVAGRAGRAELPGEVYIQTHDHDNAVLMQVMQGSYTKFAENELKERKNGYFPPFCHLAAINFKSKDIRQVADWAQMYSQSLSKVKGITVSEAMPSALEKAEGWYRWQIIVRAPNNSAIVAAWRWIRGERPPPKNLVVALDCDAINLV